MKVCPVNSEHKEFITGVQVTEQWLVDGEGNFLEKYDSFDCEVVVKPDPGNLWMCLECGTPANDK